MSLTGGVSAAGPSSKAASYTPLTSSSRSSPFPSNPLAGKGSVLSTAPVFMPQAQPFRPSGVGVGGLSSLAVGADRDTGGGLGAGAVGSGVSSVLIRRLPINTSEESLRLMVVWSKELVNVEVLPVERSEDPGFRSAILTFRTPAGAQEAKNMLDGKSNISNDANMIVELLPGSPVASNKRLVGGDAMVSAGASSTPSSTTSSVPSSRQTSRFNGSFQSLEKISPPTSGLLSTSSEMTTPESTTAHYQSLFTPQSPIGNHLGAGAGTSGTASATTTAPDQQHISIKTLIGDAPVDVDDDADHQLLVSQAAHQAHQAQRRATAPQIPIARMSSLSLGGPTAPPGPSSMPPYAPLGHVPKTMSPTVMNGGAGRGGVYPGGPSPHYGGRGGGGNSAGTFPPVNPADQNPPCNTLYVGNLPIDTSEEELKAMFSKQRGYKRLCFRTKQNGPMCFVEFEDVSFATKALHELYGQPLHNSVKGGIRLSFSKNPLGVRSGQNPAHHPGGHHSASAGAGSGVFGPGSLHTGGAGGMSSFTAASGPPPGLAAPPGFGNTAHGAAMPQRFGGGNGVYRGTTPVGGHHHHHQQYGMGVYGVGPSAVWGGHYPGGGIYGPSNMAAAAAAGSSSFPPSSMMGR